MEVSFSCWRRSAIYIMAQENLGAMSLVETKKVTTVFY